MTVKWEKLLRGLGFRGLLGGLAGFVGVLVLADVSLSVRSLTTASIPSFLASLVGVEAVGRSLNSRIDGATVVSPARVVNEVNGAEFGINFIPHTQAVTTWGQVAVGDLVNLEVDTMARYVARLRDWD